ncbi:hypothetical protein, conserved [Trypanosoma brucei gambiense DAL972]|uniref:Uncharacterized protein n=1 Tax=Trypanosoma brucei gambiense (strain MHOM/CI/86/DAL972) TaxID=679716 RepID=C9ZNE4_TRYB9|nr:hypothetical protein, conserved [Trypanosoma brucei gambiense DAL972]CBH10922.1 hypothetical protein, conserved [Trypanosoma brucei gambiense DAL972]|eukprot:XP_011773209.1 hypothetical protein, conserved [Trypanosoma brucei gambiense DAL972]
MEGQKYDWANAHARLWTSFKKSQESNDTPTARGDIRMDSSPTAPSVHLRNSAAVRDITTAVLAEAMGRGKADEPVFTEELEARIVWLLENEGVDSPMRDLLGAIMHLKKRIEMRGGEVAITSSRVADIVGETLYHLTGRKVSGHVNEGASTGKDFDDVNESPFLKVLMQVEKCKKTARKLAERNGICKSYDSESSLGEILDMMSSCRPCAVERTIDEDNKETLRQVMDILGASPGVPVGQAPSLTLKLTKDLEFARRDVHTCSALLHQYEKAAMSRFSSCGVVSPPTVEQERAILLSDRPNVSVSSNDQWIEREFKDVISIMTQVNQRFHLNIVPNHLRGWPTSSSAEVVFDHMRTSLESARDMIAALAEREQEVRSKLAEITRKLRHSDDRSASECSDDRFSRKLSDDTVVSGHSAAIEMAQHLGLLVDHQLKKEENVNQESLQGYRKKMREILMRILRWLPDGDGSSQGDTDPTCLSPTKAPQDEDALAGYVESVVQRFAAQSNVPDTLVPHIRELCTNVSQLADSLACGNVQCIDDSTMTTLLSTVDQLRRWVLGERCDTRSSADNALIQQCLCELAQLLPTGTSPSSCEGAVEIEPPVNNLLEMVQLLKRRQEQWVQEQHKHQASGANSRMEKARLEEIVREGGKQLVKRCKEILLISANSVEAEAVINALSDELTDDVPAVKDCAVDAAPGNNQGSTGAHSITLATTVFRDLDERLKLIKTRYHRLQHAYEANKVRLDNLIQSNIPRGKRWARICNTVGALCRAVGVEELAFRLEHDGRPESLQSPSAPTASASNTTSPAAVASAFKQTLRADLTKSDAGQSVTDGELLEALKLVESRLKDNTALCDRVSQQSRLLLLQEERKQWREEVVTFRQAIQVILQRLAEAGQRIKRSLYLLGTDECAEDDVVETVLREQECRDDDKSRLKQRQDEGDGGDPDSEWNGADEERLQKQQEVNEEALAVLLRKFGRWATRLHETTEDHLHTQKKLVKYFAAVHRFFCNANVAPPNLDSCTGALLDIDTTLMHFADGILPVLDRAIDAAQSKRKKRTGVTSCGNKALLNILNSGKSSADTGDSEACRTVTGEKDDADARNEVMSLLLQNAPADRILPADHRITRLYEMVGKLRTMVSGLLSVRYLAIPVAVGNRGSGGNSDELVFADGFGDDDYIELDLNTLRAVGGKGSKEGTAGIEGDHNSGSGAAANIESKGSDGATYVSDEKLLRIVESNVTAVYQALAKFSTDYKLAAILLQKDTESMQHFIAEMLKYYIELDVKRGFGQDPEMLRELYILIHERAKRQRGCYFFSRVGGEGPCVWSAALEQLSCGFIGILEKLHKRTETAAELRELVDDVVDICAMYVNWVDTTGATITSLHPLPEDVLTACIRQDVVAEEEVMSVVEGNQLQPHGNQSCDRCSDARDELEVEDVRDSGEEVPKPPLPPGHSRPKVSHFKKDDIVLKVIAHMFQVAQEVLSLSGSNSERTQQLEEQLQLLRESVAVAEQGRDKALSEAAVSRAELRRWRRQHHVPDDQLQPPPPLPIVQQHQQEKRPSGLERPVSPSPVTTITIDDEGIHPGVGRAPPPSAVAPGRDDALLHVAEVMKELTDELRGVCGRRGSDISYPPVATVLDSTSKTLTASEGSRRRVMMDTESDFYSGASVSTATFQRGLATRGSTAGAPLVREQKGNAMQYGKSSPSFAPPTTPPRSGNKELSPMGEMSASPPSFQPPSQGLQTQQRPQGIIQSYDEGRHSPAARDTVVLASGGTKYTTRAPSTQHYRSHSEGVNAHERDVSTRQRHAGRSRGGAVSDMVGGLQTKSDGRRTTSATRAPVTRTPPSLSAALRGQSPQANPRTPVRVAASPSSLSSPNAAAPTAAAPIRRSSPHSRKYRDGMEELMDGLYANYHAYHDCVCGNQPKGHHGSGVLKSTNRPAAVVASRQCARNRKPGTTGDRYCENVKRSPGGSLSVRTTVSGKSYAAGGGQARPHSSNEEDYTLHMSSLHNTGSSIVISPDSTAAYPDVGDTDASRRGRDRRQIGHEAQGLFFRGLEREESLRGPARQVISGTRSPSRARDGGGLRGILKQQHHQRQSTVTPTRRVSSLGYGVNDYAHGANSKQLLDVVARTKVGKRDEF